ncbi:transcription factor SPEECHLESS-like [Macadamia integrifolia]|uniref:transcription factor SPEECHLESS-like n=1 Tax=Macadamia integrifolia TaxID=60698 RepID=UPI001C4F9220|nr:transcription factor SPEECHLESS-like [Macadamia integrifolia]
MEEGGGNFSNLFEESEFGDPNQLAGAASPEDLFSILETLEGVSEFDSFTSFDETTTALLSPKVGGTTSSSNATLQDYSETDAEAEAAHARKRRKLSEISMEDSETNPDGLPRMTHIAVERNRRKQMNENLSVLRSLMPCFYVKRGDQASIIGGVVDYITELQQVLKSLEAKKQRKVYSEVLSPRLVSGSPRPSPLSPRRPPPSPLSPRLNLPISPRTPQPGSPYMPRMTMATNQLEPSSSSSSSSSPSLDNVKELAANSKSSIADVEVKFSGTNVLLKTISPKIPGQAVKIVAALEGLALEILHVSITAFDDTMLNSFTIKIGFECELSAEELAHEIQQTFC